MGTTDFLATLSDGDANARARGLESLRYVHLKDPAVLDRVLALCADDAPTSGVRGDPISAFFGGSSQALAVGDVAVERLDRAGLPPVSDASAAVARAVRASRSPRLASAAARWLAETGWESREDAARAILPALAESDASIAALLVRGDDVTVAVAIEVALSGWFPRLLHELQNHPPSHDRVVKALADAVIDGRFATSPSEAAEVLALLCAHGDKVAARVCAAVERREPWAVVFRAIADRSATGDLVAWLAAGAPSAPPGLDARVDELLRGLGPVEGFPLAAWLERFGSPGLVAAWDSPPDAIPALRRWASAVADPNDVRAWNAASLLLAAQAHEPILGLLAAAMKAGLPEEPELVRRLAAARPVVPGVADAVAREITRRPDTLVTLAGAIAALPLAEVRPVLLAALAVAEASDVVERPAGKGVVMVRRTVPAEILEDVFDAVNDPALSARLTELLPVVRGA